MLLRKRKHVEKMTFKALDLENYPRKEHFDFYLNRVPCTWSCTVKLDILPIRQLRLRLYTSMLWLLARSVNSLEAFRFAKRPDGIVGIYDQVHPSFTVLNPQLNTFSCTWCRYDDDYFTFAKAADSAIAQAKNAKGMLARTDIPDNIFNVSMIPWFHFEAFNLYLPQSVNYFAPIFTIGQFKEEKGRTLIPLAFQVHHAVCDGLHASLLLKKLQSEINALVIKKP